LLSSLNRTLAIEKTPKAGANQRLKKNSISTVKHKLKATENTWVSLALVSLGAFSSF
jgi:hypothetical protein